MSFPYKRILVIGATSGIGKALASRFIQEGASVIVSGRRRENLDQFVEEHGADKAAAVPFDVSETDMIPALVEDITTRFPDLDCVFVNSGIQRTIKYHKPESVDWASFLQETNVNYLSAVALAHAFLPFLLASKRQTALLFTTSSLAIVPLVRCPGYSASKAALHAFILCLRAQLEPHPNVKVLELLPPAVNTELHDAKNQPDLGVDGPAIGIPLQEFIDEAWKSLRAGNETNLIHGKPDFKDIDRIDSSVQEAVKQVWKFTKPKDWDN